jgi:histidine triad (HIT) family protein
MSSNCSFCRIVAGDLPSKKVLETERVLAFKDISPAAPTHILIIPKQHITDPQSLNTGTAPLIGDLFLAAKQIAEEHGLASSGYRLVMNQGRDGGQSVFHMHLHLLAGRRMSWPPG